MSRTRATTTIQPPARTQETTIEPPAESPETTPEPPATPKAAGPRCPRCGGADVHVTHTRSRAYPDMIAVRMSDRRRRYECRSCGATWWVRHRVTEEAKPVARP